MQQENNFTQALLDFLLASPEGRATLSAILTAFIGSAIRLLIAKSEQRGTDRGDILRLEQQDALEQEIEVIKQQMLELKLVLDRLEER